MTLSHFWISSILSRHPRRKLHLHMKEYPELCEIKMCIRDREYSDIPVNLADKLLIFYLIAILYIKLYLCICIKQCENLSLIHI